MILQLQKSASIQPRAGFRNIHTPTPTYPSRPDFESSAAIADIDDGAVKLAGTTTSGAAVGNDMGTTNATSECPCVCVSLQKNLSCSVLDWKYRMCFIKFAGPLSGAINHKICTKNQSKPSELRKKRYVAISSGRNRLVINTRRVSTLEKTWHDLRRCCITKKLGWRQFYSKYEPARHCISRPPHNQATGTLLHANLEKNDHDQ